MLENELKRAKERVQKMKVSSRSCLTILTAPYTNMIF